MITSTKGYREDNQINIDLETDKVNNEEIELEKDYKQLKRIVDLASVKIDNREIADLSEYRVVDQMPSGNILMEDVIRDYISGDKYIGGENIVVSARISDLWGDPTYNRVEDINYNNCEKQIRNVGGFSFFASDILSAFLRPDGRVVCTKGNHRVTMRYLVDQDRSARVIVSLKLHSKCASIAQMVIDEARDHTFDCSYRTPQKGDDKFKSNYYAQEPWAVKLYKDCAKFSIGIAGTNPNAKFDLPRYSYLTRAQNNNGIECTEKFLKAFTEKDCSKVIGGNIIVAGSSFCKHFKKIINDVDTQYGVDSFADMLNFYFHEWRPLMEQIGEPDAKNVTQEMITDAAAWNNPPGQEPGISRFVMLYNTYGARNKYILKGHSNTVIPFKSDSKSNEWNMFLDTCHPYIRPAMYNVATTKFF